MKINLMYMVAVLVVLGCTAQPERVCPVDVLGENSSTIEMELDRSLISINEGCEGYGGSGIAYMFTVRNRSDTDILLGKGGYFLDVHNAFLQNDTFHFGGIVEKKGLISGNLVHVVAVEDSILLNDRIDYTQYMGQSYENIARPCFVYTAIASSEDKARATNRDRPTTAFEGQIYVHYSSGFQVEIKHCKGRN
jgi:hypothetical protein